MLHGQFHYDDLKHLDPRLGLNDRVRRTRQRPLGIRVRRRPGSTEE